MLASVFLIVLAPRAGTLLLEFVAALLLIVRGFVLRARLRRPAQLRLNWAPSPPPLAGFLTFGRYEVWVIITVILGSAVAAGPFRAMGVPDAAVHAMPLVLFALGLAAKSWILRWFGRRKARRAATPLAEVDS